MSFAVQQFMLTAADAIYRRCQSVRAEKVGNQKNAFRAIYYPFSRCMDVTQMKQLLLLFDNVTFVDPVQDEKWRNFLFTETVNEDARFGSYRDVSAFMPWLRQEGVVSFVRPAGLKSINADLTVAATLSDLSNESWISKATPHPYGIPTQMTADGRASWQTFESKIPKKIIDLLSNDEQFSRHVFTAGNERHAWELSYAAGSAISINTHFAAAEELQLAPVTDSQLHHDLMLAKLARTAVETKSRLAIESYSDQISQRSVSRVLGQILPPDQMDHLSLADIIEFRCRTEELRREFIGEIRTTILVKLDLKDGQADLKTESEVVTSLLKGMKSYGDEVASVRDKLWPKLIDGFATPWAAGTTTAGLAASYIAGSGYVLAASIALQALQPLKAALEWRAEQRKVHRSAATGMAYLSQIQRLRS